MDSDYSEPKKSGGGFWKWLLIILIIIALAGVAGYFVKKHNDDEKKKKAAAAAVTAQAVNNQKKANAFSALANSNIPYVATVKSTSGDKTTTGTITSDGQGNTSYAYTVGTTTGTLIFTKDAYYACSSSSSCVKYPKSQSSSASFDPSTYQYDGSKLAELKNSANYKGQQACPAPATGTCDVWSVTSNNVTSTIYVNASTHKIARVTTASGTTQNEVTYDYKNATVTVPANATTAPTQ